MSSAGKPRTTYRLGCHGSHAWALLAGPVTAPCSRGDAGVVGLVRLASFVLWLLLLGVGHTVVLLAETSLAFLKEKKNNHERDREVSSLVPQSPLFLELTGRPCHRRR